MHYMHYMQYMHYMHYMPYMHYMHYMHSSQIDKRYFRAAFPLLIGTKLECDNQSWSPIKR